MLRRVLNQLCDLVPFRTRLRKLSRRLPLRLEVLEDRTLPATITWINAAGGSWHTAANWDLNRTPTTGDDVVIPDLGAAGPNITIAYSTGTTTALNSVTSPENVTLSGGPAGGSPKVARGQLEPGR